MNNPFRILRLRLCLVPCTLCLLFLSSCENDERMIDEWTKKSEAVEEATNIESYLSQNGLLKAKLTAPLMVRVTGGVDTLYVEFPNKLHCDFYDDSTKRETWLDANYGKYFETLNKVYLRDSVIVISTKGDTLRTPDLWWDQNTKMFYTDKYAVYRGPNNLIRGGRGMEATQDLTSVIFHDVTGEMKVSDSGFPEQ